MKKYITLFILIVLLVTSCGSETNDPITFIMEHNSKEDIDARYGEDCFKFENSAGIDYNIYTYNHIIFLNYEGKLTIDYDENDKMETYQWCMYPGNDSESYIKDIEDNIVKALSKKLGKASQSKDYDYYWNIGTNSIRVSNWLTNHNDNYETVIAIDFSNFNINE